MPTPHRQPRYRAIADELRHRMTTGVIPAGALIPSEKTLTAEFRVARGTIRQAINVLRSEGLVVTDHGRGTYARPDLPVRHFGPERYRAQRQEAPVNGADCNRQHGTEQTENAYQEVVATAELADLCQVEPGTVLLEHRALYRERGVPYQIVTSYLSSEMMIELPLAKAEDAPCPSEHIVRLRNAGIAVTKILEVVRARAPSVDEMRALQLSIGVPVLAITRRTFSGERVVHVSADIVMRADCVAVEYAITT
ncbi:GntR family transcriptional regulator [Plantactinospora sp. DSM 117369]